MRPSALRPHGSGEQGRDEAEDRHQPECHAQSRVIRDEPDQGRADEQTGISRCHPDFCRPERRLPIPDADL